MNHLSVADVESEELLRYEPRVHARDDHKPALSHESSCSATAHGRHTYAYDSDRTNAHILTGACIARSDSRMDQGTNWLILYLYIERTML